MVWEPDFRSHLKYGIWPNRPLFDFLKSRRIWISDTYSKFRCAHKHRKLKKYKFWSRRQRNVQKSASHRHLFFLLFPLCICVPREDGLVQLLCLDHIVLVEVLELAAVRQDGVQIVLKVKQNKLVFVKIKHSGDLNNGLVPYSKG